MSSELPKRTTSTPGKSFSSARIAPALLYLPLASSSRSVRRISGGVRSEIPSFSMSFSPSNGMSDPAVRTPTRQTSGCSPQAQDVRIRDGRSPRSPNHSACTPYPCCDRACPGPRKPSGSPSPEHRPALKGVAGHRLQTIVDHILDAQACGNRVLKADGIAIVIDAECDPARPIIGECAHRLQERRRNAFLVLNRRCFPDNRALRFIRLQYRLQDDF